MMSLFIMQGKVYCFLLFLQNQVFHNIDLAEYVPYYLTCVLTHWDRVMYTYISKITIIGSNNGLSPIPHQAIIWTNIGL